MKKILIIIIMLLAFSQINVNAKEEQFYGAEKIENMWIKKVKGNKVEYHQAAVIRRKSDNKYVYCIEPWSVISEKVVYNDIIDANTIDDETIKQISLAAYYGYGTTGHNNINWYYITQVAIWKIIDKEADFYFTDSLNGNRITSYDGSVSQILNLVKLHSKKPNFSKSEITIPLGSTLTLADNNQVLNNFNKNEITNASTTINENLLTIKGKKIGEDELVFTKNNLRFDEPALVYKHATNQNFLAAGNLSSQSTKLKIKVVGGRITVNKLDKDTNSTISPGESTLAESTFRLYNSNLEVVDEKETYNNTITFSNLQIGTYYLEEIKAGTGYEINKDQKVINLTEENYNITTEFYNKVIENEITIHKLFGKNNNWENEENAIFNVFNQKQELIDTIKTDKLGIAKIKLPYGTYHFIQTYGRSNYQLSKPFIIKIEESSKKINITKYNQEILGSINILKIDSKTNLPIKNNTAIFKIFDYYNNKWLDKLYQTDNNGFLSIENLSIGKYKIVEVKTPNGYENPQEHIVEINEDNLNPYIEITNEKEIISIPKTNIIVKENTISKNITIWILPLTILTFLIKTFLQNKKVIKDSFINQ